MIHTVVGLIFNEQSQILIAERPLHKYLGGLWEFPGGKVEPGEAPLGALQRELAEELGIQVLKALPFWQGSHAYSNYDVRLEVFQITEFRGVPFSKEGQKIQWVNLLELPKFPFLEGNQAIIQKITN